MKCSAEVLDEVRNAIESIEFGEVKIKVNSAGDYVEVCTEKRTRVSKDGDSSSYEGKIRVYRTDN
jgi:hypothetical protein